LHMLESSDLTAIYLPGRGMLAASLRHRGEELLGLVDDLSDRVQQGDPCGIPLLHPWANRLSGWTYRAAGRQTSLDPASPLVFRDAAGLPMHGIPWARLPWTIESAQQDRLTARLDWDRPEWLAVFPYRHRLTMAVSLSPSTLTVATTLAATGETGVPVSFGFHPYFRLPGVRRSDLLVSLPAMSHLLLDEHQIPTGEDVPYPGLDQPLGQHVFDDGYALLGPTASFAVAGGGRRIGVELTSGYTHAQIYAPPSKDYIAIEPMTATANSLVSGDGLRIVAPGESFTATFQVAVRSVSESR
jgi:aldose 1-epimerase